MTDEAAKIAAATPPRERRKLDLTVFSSFLGCLINASMAYAIITAGITCLLNPAFP
jgi:hypothetical protein